MALSSATRNTFSGRATGGRAWIAGLSGHLFNNRQVGMKDDPSRAGLDDQIAGRGWATLSQGQARPVPPGPRVWLVQLRNFSNICSKVPPAVPRPFIRDPRAEVDRLRRIFQPDLPIVNDLIALFKGCARIWRTGRRSRSPPPVHRRRRVWRPPWPALAWADCGCSPIQWRGGATAAAAGLDPAHSIFARSQQVVTMSGGNFRRNCRMVVANSC